MAIEALLGDALVAMLLLGWGGLKLIRCAGCEAPFSAPEAIVRTLLSDWSCRPCRRTEGRVETASSTVRSAPIDADLVRRHEELLAALGKSLTATS